MAIPLKLSLKLNLLNNCLIKTVSINSRIGDRIRCVSSEPQFGSIHSIIESKLKNKLQPIYLKVLNESHMHNVEKGSETHFRVVIVSPKFESLTALKRHQMINEVLKHEISVNIHALAIQAMTPQQWTQNKKIDTSPTCRGGMGL